MPNWCTNDLLIEGPNEDIERFIEAARGQSAKYDTSGVSEELTAALGGVAVPIEPLCFNALFPVPSYILAQGYNKAGYDWQHSNWGTKWDMDGSTDIYVEDGFVRYFFDTANTPPIALISHVAFDWPTLTFELRYVEPGNNFGGIFTASADGQNDECFGLQEGYENDTLPDWVYDLAPYLEESYED